MRFSQNVYTCSPANYILEVIEIFVQYHCLSSYRNDLYRNNFVSKRLVLLSHFECNSSGLQLDFPKADHVLSFLVPRMVVLDPTLTKILLNKNEDIAFLPWDQLIER